MSQPATFIRRSTIERMGLLDEELYFLLDWEYFIRLGKVCKFRHVPEVFATYRLHRVAKTAVQAGQNKFAEEKARVIARDSHNPSGFAAVNSVYHTLWYAVSFLARAFVVLRSNPINFMKYVRYKRAGYS